MAYIVPGVFALFPLHFYSENFQNYRRVDKIVQSAVPFPYVGSSTVNILLHLLMYTFISIYASVSLHVLFPEP